MNRLYKACMLIMVLFLVPPLTVQADGGPKPSLKINAVNMPSAQCYIDLLVDYSPESAYKNISETDKYNQKLFSMLKEYDADGWRPAMVTGTWAPMYGDIICNVINGKCTLSYKYLGIPNKFKIIVVSADGSIKVSNAIRRKAFNSTVDFDYASGKASETSEVLSYILKLIATCLETLIIEGIILLCFKFSLKENLGVFIAINVSTQVLLTYVVFMAMYKSGTYAAVLSYMRFEIAIVIVEAYLFSIYLKGHTTARKVLYAITANIASFIIGLLIL